MYMVRICKKKECSNIIFHYHSIQLGDGAEAGQGPHDAAQGHQR